MDSGADLSITFEDGDSYLHIAARHGHTAVLEELLSSVDAAGSIDGERIDGRTPLMCAVSEEKIIAKAANHNHFSSISQTQLINIVIIHPIIFKKIHAINLIAVAP